MNTQQTIGTMLLGILFLLIMWGPVVAYLVLQIRALMKLRGGRRIFAAIPLLFMIPVYVVTIIALSQGSNLWPLILIFASPVACVWLVIALLANRAT